MPWDYREDELIKHLKESFEIVEKNENLPPGFDIGDEVTDLDQLPIEGGAEVDVSEADTPVNPEAEPLRTKYKGTDADLDAIVYSRFPAPEKIKNIAQGIHNLRLSRPLSKREKAKHLDALMKIGLEPEQAKDLIKQQVAKAKELIGKEPSSSEGGLASSAERLQRLIHNSVVLKILTDDGTAVDGEKFKELINVVPERIISNNAKIDKSGRTNEKFYEITLPAYQGLYYDNKENKFKLLRTCPNAGECKMFCYATKGGYVQYEGTNLRQMRMLNYLMNDWKGFKGKILKELEEAKKKEKDVKLRWHDSGDFFTDAYLEVAFDVARETPDVTHYAYTKNVRLINKYKESKPKNFIFNFSEGGTQDKLIEPTDKNSKVIPKAIWKDLFTNKEDFKDDAKLQELKKRIADVYGKLGITVENILTYDELMKTPDGDEPKWHVIVTPKDGDDAAARNDVISSLLLAH